MITQKFFPYNFYGKIISEKLPADGSEWDETAIFTKYFIKNYGNSVVISWKFTRKKMKNGRCEKLECNLNNKEVFIQKAVNRGIKLENIYKVIKFN